MIVPEVVAVAFDALAFCNEATALEASRSLALIPTATSPSLIFASDVRPLPDWVKVESLT